MVPRNFEPAEHDVKGWLDSCRSEAYRCAVAVATLAKACPPQLEHGSPAVCLTGHPRRDQMLVQPADLQLS